MTDSVSRVVIVGVGNAALCAALAAREGGASVTVLERAPQDESGGNSRFTAGAFRCAYSGLEDLLKLMPDLSENEIATTDFGTYTEDQYLDDMFRVTNYRSDPDLVECLVRQSSQTMLWMRGMDVRFMPIYGRQAFKVEGKFTFWGGRGVWEDRGYFRGARQRIELDANAAMPGATEGSSRRLHSARGIADADQPSHLFLHARN